MGVIPRRRPVDVVGRILKKEGAAAAAVGGDREDGHDVGAGDRDVDAEIAPPPATLIATASHEVRDLADGAADAVVGARRVDREESGVADEPDRERLTEKEVDHQPRAWR